MGCDDVGRAVALGLALAFATPTLVQSQPSDSRGVAATDGPGGSAAWTTGNKLAVGASADLDSKVWFTVAKGITSEVFYPRLDIPNMEDMQYIITDGSTFVDLERDATSHAISMPTENALEYAVTNMDTRPSAKYRITNTYITDPSRNTLLIRTRFESLDGGVYKLYLHANPSIAGGGASNSAWWDGANSALMASATRPLFGSPMTIVSALKVGGPNGFVGNDNGFATMASDCAVELHKDMALVSRFDSASEGNVVQCGEIGNVGADTTFTIALGYGGDAATALAAADGSLGAGFGDREAAYRKGWRDYVDGLRPLPASVSSDTLRRRVYYVAAMALHAAEDKTFRGASVAGFGTPWGDFANGDQPNDGYHRVWGRDLYQQAMGLIAAGDSGQALRMSQFLWTSQFAGAATPGDGTTYQPGSFPRYSPVSGIGGATAKDLGCCEQRDEEAFAIVLAWMTGLTDNAAYQKIKMTADHIVGTGPVTTERWEEKKGLSPSSLAATVAGLVAAADIARQNGDPMSAGEWESTADSWRSSVAAWTFTTDGYWGDQHYYERIDPAPDPNPNPTLDPNGPQTIQFDEGAFLAHDVADFGFLDLVRLGVLAPDDANVSASLAPSAAASDGNSTVQVTMPNGDIYFHRYNHDNYGESDSDCTGWQLVHGPNHYGRFWPVLSGERGEYELANGRPANLYLQSMADAANDGYFVPEQAWDRADIACFAAGRPTGSAAPLDWAEGQYLRLAQSIDAGYDLDTPSVAKAKYRGAGPILGAAGKCVDDAGASTDNGAAIQLFTCNGTGAQSWAWNSGDGTLRVLNKCMDVTGGATASGTPLQLWDCNGTGAQEWRWRQQSRLVNPQSGHCLDVTGAGGADGTRLQISDCGDAAGQVWRLP
jgi:glucoamylase